MTTAREYLSRGHAWNDPVHARERQRMLANLYQPNAEYDAIIARRALLGDAFWSTLPTTTHIALSHYLEQKIRVYRRAGGGASGIMTATVDRAALVTAQAKAWATAEQAQARAATASAELAAAEAALESERQEKYRAWCVQVVANRRADEQAARQAIVDMRASFVDAVALGDLGTALAAYLDWAEAAAAQSGLWRRLTHALNQVDPTATMPELSYRHQPGSFTEELSKAVASASARRNADLDDATQAEIDRAIKGEVVIDAPEAPPRPRKGS